MKGHDSDSRPSDLDLDRVQRELKFREDELERVREILQERTRTMQEQHAYIDQLVIPFLTKYALPVRSS